MRRRCASATGPTRATLWGWAFGFDLIAVERDGTGEANVVPRRGARVEGALYGLARVDLLRLDPAMGHPRRRSRRMLRLVDAGGNEVAAWVYVGTPEWRADRLAPRGDDVGRLIALAGIFSAEYRKELSRFAATKGEEHR